MDQIAMLGQEGPQIYHVQIFSLLKLSDVQIHVSLNYSNLFNLRSNISKL